VIGREFSWRLLRAVAAQDEDSLAAALARLVGAELVYARGLPPDSTYLFKHALVQDAAYASLLRGRRRELHRATAEALASGHGGAAAAPEVLALHWTEAGDAERGVELWRRAGRSAVTRGAYVEAERHLRRGLEVLAALPDGELRDRVELGLSIPLGQALLAKSGADEDVAMQIYGRARVLCEKLGELRRLFPVLLGSFTQALSRLDLALSEQLCREIERGAERDRSLEIWAELARGHIHHERARGPEAQQALERVLTLYDEARHREDLMDPAALALTFVMWMVMMTGMMLPSAAPTVLLYGAMVRKHAERGARSGARACAGASACARARRRSTISSWTGFITIRRLVAVQRCPVVP